MAWLVSCHFQNIYVKTSLETTLIFGSCKASGLPDDKALRLPSTYGMPKQITILYSNHS